MEYSKSWNDGFVKSSCKCLQMEEIITMPHFVLNVNIYMMTFCQVPMSIACCTVMNSNVLGLVILDCIGYLIRVLQCVNLDAAETSFAVG